MENSLMPVLQMPNIQKLANDGMKFGNAYGAPQCAPARVCVQTGQSAPHSGFTVYLGSREPYFDTKDDALSRTGRSAIPQGKPEL